MKIVIGIAAAGLAAFVVAAAPAGAWTLSPTSTKVTLTGDTSATVNGAGLTLPCHATIKGNISSSGVGFIRSGAFTTSTGPQGQCEAVTLQNTPWKTVAKSKSKVRLNNVTFQVAGITCGPGPLPVTLKDGVATFTDVPLPGGVGAGCTVSGNLTSSPTLSIVP